MSRKSKGECTCKIVAQNERGMLGQVRDSVYRGVKYYGEDGQVEKRFCFPRKLAEEKSTSAMPTICAQRWRQPVLCSPRR